VKFAFFELEGTLIQGTPWTGVLQYPGISRFKIARLLAFNVPRYLLFQTYLMGQARFRAGWIRGVAGLISQWPQSDVDKLFDWLANEYLVPYYREDIIGILKQHQQEDVQVVLITSFFEEAARKIAERFGATNAIGSRLNFKNGRATGRLKGKACVGQRKLDFVRTYLHEQGHDTNLKDCIGYANSYSDGALLAAMGEAVAIYPDSELRAAAKEQGWRIHEGTNNKKSPV
jgi:HAD superfamily hydrolase (TIGR01490 family)